MASGKSSRERFTVGTAADAASPFARLWPEARAAEEPGRLSGGAPVALAALPVALAAPPHPSLDMLARLTVEGVILPVGRTVAHGRDWIVCPTPGRPSARSLARPDERWLVTRVLQPVATVLERVHAQQLVHRAIRPDNVFVSDEGVELGPFWLTPPAYGQPAVFETPSAASCPAAARGQGTIADDVYALGVTLLAIYLGEVPMAGLPEAEVIERKLWLGSYTALTEGHRIPFALAEVIAAMVSDQASQRPTPERLRRASTLTGPATSSRKRVNAAIPMMLGGREVWNAPQLAFLCGEEPEMAATALETGQIDVWLRRGLNEVVLAERIETLVHPGGLRSRAKVPLDPLSRTRLLSRVAHALDPEAPCLWGRLRVMTDGVPGLLAAIGAHPLITAETVGSFLSSDALVARAIDEPVGLRREFASMLARRGTAAARSPAALARLCCELNPSMGCASPLLAGHPVGDLSSLLPALEAVAPEGSGRLLDHHLLGFIGVRRLAAGMRNVRSGDELAELRLLAALSDDLRQGPWPLLARRLAEPVLAGLEQWPGRSRQVVRRAAIEGLVSAGDLTGLVALASNPAALEADSAARGVGHARIGALRARRAEVTRARGERETTALRFGREGVVVLGTAACAIALALQVVTLP